MENKIIRLGVDVDDVLRDITPSIMDVFIKHYPKSVINNVIDGWDFPNIDLPIEKKKHIMFYEFPKEIFLYSQPVKNTYAEFKTLRDWANKNNVKLVCVTTQEDHLIGLTYTWLAMHNLLFKEIHISHNKHECPIDYLIDDAEHNCEKWINSGRDPNTFILFDALRNQTTNHPIRVKKLSESIKFIKL